MSNSHKIIPVPALDAADPDCVEKALSKILERERSELSSDILSFVASEEEVARAYPETETDKKMLGIYKERTSDFAATLRNWTLKNE